VSQGLHALIDGELFLPASWNPGEAQINELRKQCGIPDGVRHRTKAAMSLGQLRRALSNTIGGQWVTADEHYGGTPWWRNAVAAMDLYYVVEIPRNTYGWIRKPCWKLPLSRSKTGRPVKRRVASPAPHWVEQLADEIDQVWQAYRVHETQKGPEIWEFKESAFYATVSRQACAQGPLRLLVGRNPLTGEIKYFLSNAPLRYSLDQLVSVAFSRWRVERCFEDCKGELGMNHAEIRSWRGLSRHYILTAVNYFFLVMLRRDWGKKSRPGSDHQPAERRNPALGSGPNGRPA
jgi:SRSO17 transposase